MTDQMLWLQTFFSRLCDGEWEHEKGIKISTLDNPGWSVDVDMTDLPLQLSPFTRVEVERGRDDWMHCWSEGALFRGRGGPMNLGEILEQLKQWVDGGA